MVVEPETTRISPKGDNQRTAATIQRELEFLAKRHSHLLSLGEEESAKKKVKERRKILEARHATREFHGNYEMEADGDGYYLSLFDEFARAVCHTAVIPRKELFECWAMALYVHFHFPPSPEDDETAAEGRRTYFRRVADMGCGQGLVSWAILFLDKSRTRTAIGIDKKIPKSADLIETVMKDHHPSVAEFQEGNRDVEIEETKEEDTANTVPTPESKEQQRATSIKRWHWVEGDICRNVSADSSTLIVGVHCCGTLSDTILDMAISSRSALALVPCCHTRKSLPKEYQKNPQKLKELLAEDAKKNQNLCSNGGNSDADTQENPPSTSLTDYIDRCRMQKLIDAGFDVREETIPYVITPKNRIIVATPPPPEDILPGVEDEKTADSPLVDSSTRYERPKNVLTIPLADTSSARAIVVSQSGRLAADLRQRRPPPNLALSLYFSDPDAMTSEKLNEFSNAIALQEQHKHFPDACSGGKIIGPTPPIIVTHVKCGTKGFYHHPEIGKVSRSFHICYEINDPTGRLPQVTKAQAKELHKVVCQRIIDNAFPSITLRQGIR